MIANNKKVVKKPIKKSNVGFNPTVEKVGGKAAVSVVWTTENVGIAINNIKNGRKTYSPFYEKNPSRRAADVVFRPSPKEMDEYFECMMDLHYFAEEHCKLKNNGVVGGIKLRDYQDEQLRLFLNEPKKRHIMLWSRQAAKTTTSCIFILWNMTFKNDKLCAILGNKLDTSKEVLNKIKEIYENLPFHLQAGIIGWNEKTLAFDNKSIMLARPCTKDALNGLTVFILYIDEFAFCFDGDKKAQEEFLSQAQPTLAAAGKDSILIITSTPNGKDLFHKLYDRAVKGLNSYTPTKVYWWQIPNRDEEWAKTWISDIGLEKFKIQFELSFDASMDKLLDSATMLKLDKSISEFYDSRKKFEFGFLENYSMGDDSNAFRISKDFMESESDIKKDYYITTSDLAEGLGGESDATTAHAFKIQHKMVKGIPYIYFKQEMVYESNKHSLHSFSKFMCHLHCDILEQENTRYLFEANKYGDHHRLQILNIGDEDFDRELYSETFFKFRRSVDSTRTSIGLLTNRAIKPLAVEGFKKAMENNLYEITDKETIEQIKNFQRDKKGNYQAEVGHDDLVTPIINMSWLVSLNPNSLREVIEEYLESINIESEEYKMMANLDDSDSRYMKKMALKE